MKAYSKEGDTELNVNVGYGFMVFHLLVLQGVPIGKESEVHPNAYLFKPSKKTKSSSTTSEASISSSASLQTLIEKKRKHKVVKNQSCV